MDTLTFDDVKKQAADDLRSVADLLTKAADVVGQGDMGRMDETIDNLKRWHNLLLLRHCARMDMYGGVDAAEQPTD